MKEAIEITKRWDSFDKIHFVSAAVSKDTIRPVLQYIYVENGVATATDGFRLHEVTGVDLDDGYYSVIKRSKSSVLLQPVESGKEYPATQGIRPNLKFCKAYTLDNSSKEAFVASCMGQACRGMSYKYLLDLYGVVTTMYVPKSKSAKCVVFTSADNQYYACVVILK